MACLLTSKPGTDGLSWAAAPGFGLGFLQEASRLLPLRLLAPFCILVRRLLIGFWHSASGSEDYLYCLENVPSTHIESQIFMGEMHMDGVFVKFNNNGGSVNKEDHLHHCTFTDIAGFL